MLRKETALMLLVLVGTPGCTRVKQESVTSREGTPAPSPEARDTPWPPPPHVLDQNMPTPPSRPGGTPYREDSAAEALQFSEEGMTGRTEVRWDPDNSRLAYQSMTPQKRERWERQPSRAEWDRFWKAMDTLGVWEWKEDYGQPAAQTDCRSWAVALKHGKRSMRSHGCSMFPEGGAWDQLVAEVTRLRGGPEVAASQARMLSKKLKESPDWKARAEAARALGALGPAAAVAAPALVDALGWPPPSAAGAAPGTELAEVAMRALAGIGETAAPELARALKNDNPDRRRRAATALEMMGTQAASAIPALTEALHDRIVRQGAARALVRIDRSTVQTVAPILIEGLNDPDANVARLSASALGEIGAATPAVVPALARALEDSRTQAEAVVALARIGPGAGGAVPDLVKALKDKNEAVRQGAASALGQIGAGARGAIPALIDALNNDRNGGVRERAARALGAMGPAASAAVPALINSLRYGDGGHSIATGASIGLAQIGLPAVPALIAALKCKDNDLGPGTLMSATGYQGPGRPEIENVRYYAAQALLQIGSPASSAVPALTEALRDEHPRVRERAAQALKEIQR